MAQHPRPPGVPSIAPVPPGIRRPFWSVMIPTYNRAVYLPETLASVLNQDPGPAEMQIEVVDDCSTEDDPEPVLRRLGLLGRVRFSRLGQRVPLSAAWNACVERATGHWIHILHSDDLVLPGFYETLREAVEGHPEAGAAFSRPIFVDEEGHWTRIGEMVSRKAGLLQDCRGKMVLYNRVACAGIVVKREVFEEVGGFHPELEYTPDWEMWRRIAVSFPMWHEPRPLACYRVHALSETSRLSRSGLTVSDARKSIAICRSYLMGADAARLSDKAREVCAISALGEASTALRAGRLDLGCMLVCEALKTSHSLHVIDRLSVLAITSVLSSAKRVLKKLLRLGPERDKWVRDWSDSGWSNAAPLRRSAAHLRDRAGARR